MIKNFSLFCFLSCFFISNSLRARTQTTLDYADRVHAKSSEKFMVVSQNTHATEAGYEILNRGGNAVDAAVAVGFALAVTSSGNGNIGGGGFLVAYKKDGTTFTIVILVILTAIALTSCSNHNNWIIFVRFVITKLRTKFPAIEHRHVVIGCYYVGLEPFHSLIPFKSIISRYHLIIQFFKHTRN